MQQLSGKVAVITGAASGIGLGMARAFAAAKLRLVLADIESAALADAAATLTADGADVITVRTDVSDPTAVEALAERAYSAFGAVNVLCNNAGVIENNMPTWEYSLDDWNWVLGINLMGVVHGIRAFVPRMLDGGEAGHIVNTASFGGLISGSATPIYIASKHAVVALSENLHHDFVNRGAPIGVSALCPGWVRTAILESDRNRAEAGGARRQTRAYPTAVSAGYRLGDRAGRRGTPGSRCDRCRAFLYSHPPRMARRCPRTLRCRYRG